MDGKILLSIPRTLIESTNFETRLGVDKVKPKGWLSQIIPEGYNITTQWYQLNSTSSANGENEV